MWVPTILVVVWVSIYFLPNFSRNITKLRIYFYFSIISFATCMMFIFWPYYLLNPRSPKNTKFTSRLLAHLVKITDLKFELRNGAILAEDRAAIIVANHQSVLDFIGMILVNQTADKVTAVAKKEILYILPMGITLYLCGVIFINRKDAKKSYRKLEIAAENLKDSKTKLWIYPEGTRNKDLTTFLSFKKGAFAAAVKAQLPVIPFIFSPYHFFSEEKETLYKKGPIVMECLAPVSTVGMTAADVPALADHVRALMIDKFKQLSEEVLNYSNAVDRRLSSRPLLEIKWN